MPLTTVQSGMMDSVAQYYSFKNRIINGGMVIDQRNAGAAQSATTSNVYCVDRWAFAAGGTTSGTLTAQRIATNSPGSAQYAIRLARTTGTYTNSLVITQVIETVNCYDLAGQTITISFQARKGSAYSAGLTVTAITGTGADQGVNGATSGSWTGWATAGSTNVGASLTTNFQQFSFSLTLGASVQEIAVYISTTAFAGTGSANDYIDITGVQLEKGVTATSFDYRPYGTELQLCQRYYEKSFEIGTAPAQNTGSYNGAAVASSPGQLSGMSFGDTRYKVNKRTAATVTFYNPAAANAFGRDQNAGVNCTATSAWMAGESSFAITASTGSGSGITNRIGVHWSADAEL